MPCRGAVIHPVSKIDDKCRMSLVDLISQPFEGTRAAGIAHDDKDDVFVWVGRRQGRSDVFEISESIGKRGLSGGV